MGGCHLNSRKMEVAHAGPACLMRTTSAARFNIIEVVVAVHSQRHVQEKTVDESL